MRRRIGNIFLISGLIAFAAFWTPAGPARAAPEQCFGADWGELGFRDGSRGLEHAFYERARECEFPPAPFDEVLYDDGYAEGLQVYCTPENGYRVGKLNLEYFGVCPAVMERAFLAAYRRGLARWAVDHGYAGYWYGGVVVLHHLLPSKRWRHAHPDRPPKPRPLHWRDRRGEWDVNWAGRRDREADRLRDRHWQGDRDWRRLWDRTPPDHRGGAWPRIEEREAPRTEDDDRRDRVAPRAEDDDRRDRWRDRERRVQRPGGAWRPDRNDAGRRDRARPAPEEEAPEWEQDRDGTRRLPDGGGRTWRR